MSKLARCLTQGNYFAAIRLEAARLLAAESRFVQSDLELMAIETGRAAMLPGQSLLPSLLQRGGRIPPLARAGRLPVPIIRTDEETRYDSACF